MQLKPNTQQAFFPQVSVILDGSLWQSVSIPRGLSWDQFADHLLQIYLKIQISGTHLRHTVPDKIYGNRAPGDHC